MKNYCPELSDLVMRALNGDFLMQIVSFVRYLVTFVRTIYENEPPSQPVPGAYDRLYSLNSLYHQLDLYDDAPISDVCDKLQAKVNRGGFNYTFFWFCPIQGHCRGFHLMPGAEERKDPFSSLYAYLPEKVFYYFA